MPGLDGLVCVKCQNKLFNLLSLYPIGSNHITELFLSILYSKCCSYARYYYNKSTYTQFCGKFDSVIKSIQVTVFIIIMVTGM